MRLSPAGHGSWVFPLLARNDHAECVDYRPFRSVYSFHALECDFCFRVFTADPSEDSTIDGLKKYGPKE